MQQYHWQDCPAGVRAQVETFAKELQTVLGESLTGVYLHGSLAMGCFNPERSDLDLLVVTQREMSYPTRKSLAALLLANSANPHPIEISLLTRDQLQPWRYPTPFDFHYSEDYRGRFERGEWTVPVSTDPDLAAHITLTKQRGICLAGMAIEAVFPDVPPRDFQNSILLDFESARTHVTDNPVYVVLNTCRVYWYLLEKVISSKAEAGAWAAETLPEPYRPAVKQALAVYRGEQDQIEMDDHTLRNFVTYLTLRVHQIVMVEKRQQRIE